MEFIDDYAFYGNDFSRIVLPKSVKSIGSDAFNSGKTYSFIEIPKGVSLDAEAFGAYHGGCFADTVFLGTNYSLPSKMNKVILLDDFEYNEGVAFMSLGNYEMKVLVSLSLVPPRISDTFTDGQKQNLEVLVPCGTLSDYKLAPVWKDFWKISESSVTEIKNPWIKEYQTKQRYDLNGQRVDRPIPGTVYILNGKRFIGR